MIQTGVREGKKTYHCGRDRQHTHIQPRQSPNNHEISLCNICHFQTRVVNSPA